MTNKPTKRKGHGAPEAPQELDQNEFSVKITKLINSAMRKNPDHRMRREDVVPGLIAIFAEQGESDAEHRANLAWEDFERYRRFCLRGAPPL